MDSLEDNGKIVGMLNASNTIGSIIGTFVPTFISIPAVGTSITFLIFSGILLALAIIYFISGKVKSIGAVVSSIIFILSCIFGHDMILVDAYQDITIPFQMSTVEFFTLVENHLTKDGVMVVNMNMRDTQDVPTENYMHQI